MKKFLLLLFILPLLTACESVDPGHKGVEVSWGGETNLDRIYTEGLHGGLHWMFDDLVEYDCREKTIVLKFEFNDINNMITGVEIAVDYSYNSEKVNILHTKIKDFETKLEKTIKSAAKEVIPNYTAVDLNLTKRGDAELKLSKILETELPNFYAMFYRVQITDVDIPKTISDQAKLTAEQIEKNKLASQMAEEKTNLADAVVAEAKGRAEAAKYEAQRLQAITTPQMLKFKELEVMLEYAKQGKSPYGENNIFGNVPTLLKNIN